MHKVRNGIIRLQFAKNPIRESMNGNAYEFIIRAMNIRQTV